MNVHHLVAHLCIAYQRYFVIGWYINIEFSKLKWWRTSLLDGWINYIGYFHNTDRRMKKGRFCRWYFWFQNINDRRMIVNVITNVLRLITSRDRIWILVEVYPQEIHHFISLDLNWIILNNILLDPKTVFIEWIGCYTYFKRTLKAAFSFQVKCWWTLFW